MNAAEIKMIVSRASFTPRCAAYYGWIDIFEDSTPAAEVFAALPSRSSTWIREFLKCAHVAVDFMDDFDTLWRRYIDCLRSYDDCDDPLIDYDDWRSECFGALKNDLLAKPWFQALLAVDLSPAFA
jgi:hypothetical protein